MMDVTNHSDAESDLFYDANYSNEKDYYDSDEIRNSRNSSNDTENGSPIINIVEYDNIPYTSFHQLKGLSSPSEIELTTSTQDDERISQLGSVISSLSSFSDHVRLAGERSDSTENISDKINLENQIKQTQQTKSKLNSIDLKIDTNDFDIISYRKELKKRFTNLFYNHLLTDSTNTSNSNHIINHNYINIDIQNNGLGENTLVNNVKLIQVIQYHEGAIWIAKFSPDGKYLCTAGQDSRVIVWIIGSIPQINHNSDDSTNSDSLKQSNNNQINNLNKQNNINKQNNYNNNNKYQSNNILNDNQIIQSEPYRIFTGHTNDIIDIAWSKSNFILSASLDKTVSLWLVSSKERIQYFRHPDIVTSVEFHPIHDRYFISGCFDKKLRLWDIIPDGHVKAWAQTPETVSSLAYLLTIIYTLT